MKKKLFIFGAGGGAKEVLSIVHDLNQIEYQWDVQAIIDKKNSGKSLNGVKIVDHFLIDKSEKNYGICSVSDPLIKHKIVKNEIEKNGYVLPKLIHPKAIISNDAIIKTGSVIFPNAKIGPSSNIGYCAWIDYSTVIGHDVHIGQYSSIMPLSVILGNVGEKSFIGASSLLHQSKSIGNNTFIGMGTTLVQNIKDNTKVVSIPKNIRTKNE